MIAIGILSVILLSASAQEAPETCASGDVGKQFCANCVEVVRCTAAGSPPTAVSTCSGGKGCGLIGGSYDCTDSSADCSCTENICDPYEPNTLLACFAGVGIVGALNCSSESKICSDGACVEAPATTTPATVTTAAPSCTADDVFVSQLNVPACKSIYICRSDGDTEPIVSPACADDEYSDSKGKCLKLDTLSGGSCSESCSMGQCASNLDCAKYDICEDGAKVGEGSCTVDPDLFYDAEAKACGSDNTKCNPLTECDFGPIAEATTVTDGDDTTTTAMPSDSPTTSGNPTSGPTTVTGATTTPAATTRPATCTQATRGNYEYEGDCKKYWQCRETTTGVYGYVERTCLSTLVFNPSTGYCDTAANVPGCS